MFPISAIWASIQYYPKLVIASITIFDSWWYSFSKSGEIDLEVETLVQIAKLIQLLESPIFVCNTSAKCIALWNKYILTIDLRLQLLEGEEYPYLLKSLYGLLMLLPQGKAFNVLRLRLKQIRMEKKEKSNQDSQHR